MDNVYTDLYIDRDHYSMKTWSWKGC